ncbi:MAG: hypothetical protein ACK5AZ_15445 [Bryobacteraceae bacterium]
MTKEGASFRPNSLVFYEGEQRGWLSLRYSGSSQTPFDLEVEVNPANLAPGTYKASVRFYLLGGPEVIVPVSLKIVE